MSKQKTYPHVLPDHFEVSYRSFTFEMPDGTIRRSPVPEDCIKYRYKNFRDLWITPYVRSWESAHRLFIGHPTEIFEVFGDKTFTDERIACWFQDMGPVLVGENAKVLDMTFWGKEQEEESEKEQEASDVPEFEW
jgi:hypothetical protein